MKRDSTAYAAVRPAYDKRDCSVRALAVAAGCTYEQASGIFSAAGRQMKRGTDVLTSRKVHEDWLGMEYVEGIMDWPLAAFIAAHPSGSFVVHRRGHACAVVEGVLHDWEEGTGPRTRILRAWKVTEKTRAKIARTRELFA